MYPQFYDYGGAMHPTGPNHVVSLWDTKLRKFIDTGIEGVRFRKFVAKAIDMMKCE